MTSHASTAGPLGGPSLALETPKPLPTLPVEREAYPIPLGYVLETTERWSQVQAALQASEARIAEVERERDAVQGHLDRANAQFHELNSKRTLEALQANYRAETAEARLSKVVMVAKLAAEYTIDGEKLYDHSATFRALSQALSELEGK